MNAPNAQSVPMVKPTVQSGLILTTGPYKGKSIQEVSPVYVLFLLDNLTRIENLDILDWITLRAVFFGRLKAFYTVFFLEAQFKEFEKCHNAMILCPMDPAMLARVTPPSASSLDVAVVMQGLIKKVLESFSQTKSAVPPVTPMK